MAALVQLGLAIDTFALSDPLLDSVFFKYLGHFWLLLVLSSVQYLLIIFWAFWDRNINPLELQYRQLGLDPSCGVNWSRDGF